MIPRKALPVVTCAVLLCIGAASQTRKLSPHELPASARTLAQVTVKGTHFTQEQILAGSGLELGHPVSEDDFKKAAQRLGETGLFTDVAYSYQYAPAGTRLDWTLADNPQVVPARFDNFVWFPDQELMETLRARVPLFEGVVPLAGGLADQVSETLQAMLLERKIPGHADYIRGGDEQALKEVVFSVSGVDLRVRSIAFTGAGPEETAALDAAARRASGGAYLRSALRVLAAKDFRPVYLARGYLKAEFSEAQAKVVEETPEVTWVQVTIPVTPGRQYTFAGIQVAGNTAFPGDALLSKVHQKDGQPVDEIALEGDVESMTALFHSKGYMAARIEPVPSLDDEKGTASYTLQVTEGDVYKMGDLEVRGLDDKTASKVDYLWEMRGGAVYDATYFKRFVPTLKSVLNVGDWNIKVYESLDPKDHTVDVTLHFDPRPRS